MGMISDWIWRRLSGNSWTQGLRYGRAFLHLGKPGPVAFPMRLIKMGIPMVLRGVLTNQSLPVCLDWVLPFWAEKQFSPDSESFLPRGFNPISYNLTERNWTGIGNLDSAHEAIVDPRGMLTPFPEAWSLDFWLWSEESGGHDGDILAPSRMPEASQTLEGHAPRVVTRIKDKGLGLIIEAWACRDSDLDLAVEQVRVENHDETPRSFYLYCSVRPFNPEGVALIHELSYEAPGLFVINKNPGVLFIEEPELVSCSNYREGDISFQVPEPARRVMTRCPVGLCTGLAGWKVELDPGEGRGFSALVFICPEGTSTEHAKSLFSFDPGSERATVDTRWHERMSRGMQISFPDERLNQCFEANRKYLHLLDDGDFIMPGPFTYHHFWFRDSAYMVSALDITGFHESAARKLKAYPKSQRKDGLFLSQEGEWDSAGQGIWPVVEHYRLTHDLRLLNELYPCLRRAGEWIIRTRKKSQGAKGPCAGLLPAGFSAEHFGPNDYYFWDNFWGLAGLRDLAFAARVLGHKKDQEYFQREFDLYLADVEKAIAWAGQRLGRQVIPSSPYRRVDSAAVGVLAGVYPLRLFNADDARFVNTVAELRSKSFFENGFFQHMVHSGVNPYLTLHIAQCYLMQRSQSAWPLVRYLLDKASSTWTWPEAIHPRTGGGCMGDGHHGWAVADWLVFLRNLCLLEEGDTLLITPILPRTWFEPGARLSVTNAASHFGPVSFVIEFNEDEASLTFQGAFRNPPALIEWCLPEGIRQAWVDGKEFEAELARVRFSPQSRKIKIRF
jgi:hypothetical protein